ncbi:MAG: hypothetical protein IPP60_10820 [Sphingobacteriales bacterium]|nr:hypothetical protein [Sphingobacteriales bacterium]
MDEVGNDGLVGGAVTASTDEFNIKNSVFGIIPQMEQLQDILMLKI